MNLSSVWLIALLAVLCTLPWLVRWLQRRTGRLPGMPGQAAKLVSTLALGPQQRLVVVEVGAGDQRTQLVLGVTPQSVSCLHRLPMTSRDAGQAGAGAPVPGPREPSFAMELKEHGGG